MDSTIHRERERERVKCNEKVIHYSIVHRFYNSEREREKCNEKIIQDLKFHIYNSKHIFAWLSMHYYKIWISFQWSKMTSLQTVRPILKQCSTTRVQALRVPSSIRDFRTTPSTLRGNSSFRAPGTVSNQYYQYIATIMWERNHFLLSLAIYNKTQLKQKMLRKNSLLQWFQFHFYRWQMVL